MNLTEALTVTLLISATILCIALIYFLNKIVKSVQSIDLNMQGLSIKLIPLIESSLVFSKKLIRVTDEVESQLQTLKSIVSDISNRVDKILNTEARIRNRIVDASKPVVKNINAIGIGLNSFWKKFKNK
jgi:uncharacterized protein YoxC